MNQTETTPWIALSERIYHALLVLYPDAYRREYGWLMLQAFRDVSRDRYRKSGVAGVALWWGKALTDLLFTALDQHRRADFAMIKSIFTQFAGHLLIVGGTFGALAAFSQLQMDDHYTYRGVFQLLLLLIAPAWLLTGLGCIGLGMRYDRALGVAGRWTLYVSGVSLMIMSIGLLAMQFQERLWSVMYGVSVVFAAALVAFGLLHVWKPVLPVFRALPLMIASGWLVMTLGILRTNSMVANNLLSFLFLLGMGLAWLAIGIAINRQNRASITAVAVA